jgi:hypothetical protein
MMPGTGVPGIFHFRHRNYFATSVQESHSFPLCDTEKHQKSMAMSHWQQPRRRTVISAIMENY